MINFWMFFTPVRLTFMTEKTVNFPYPTFPGEKKNSCRRDSKSFYLKIFIIFVIIEQISGTASSFQM